jgi:hypothetical protein
MTENDSTAAVIDLTDDDVEGHGLREVAAGLSAAAVLAGGGAAAASMAAASSHQPVARGPVGSVTAMAHHKVDQAKVIVENAQKPNMPPPPEVAPGQSKSVDAPYYPAPVPVMERVRKDIDQVQATVQKVKDKVTAIPEERRVATVMSVVTTEAADGVHTVQVELRGGPNPGLQKQATGWITIHAADKVLAQVHMTGGTAEASWTMPESLGVEAVTISYTGDRAFAPTVRSILV